MLYYTFLDKIFSFAGSESLILFLLFKRMRTRAGGEIGRRTGFRYQRPQGHEGSSPSLPTNVMNILIGRDRLERERGRENGSFPVAEVLSKPQGFEAQSRYNGTSSEIPSLPT